jgi:hypothetical protein
MPAEQQIGKRIPEHAAPCLGVADMFVEIDDERRHNRLLRYSIIGGVRQIKRASDVPLMMKRNPMLERQLCPAQDFIENPLRHLQHHSREAGSCLGADRT